MSTISAPERKTPWHLRVVAVLTLLWNASGAYTIVMAQAGKLTDVGPDEAAYYASQPLWLVVTTDLGLVSAVAAAIALLLRSATAAWFFASALVAIVLTNGYDVAAGTSLALVDRGWLILTCVIVVLAILQLAYTLALKRRSVLV
jgi:hypothetical protein